MGQILISALSEGIIWALMGVGLFITFRILNLPDLTAEGSFTTGAAVGARLLSIGIHPLLALIASFFAGAAAGAVTGLLITRLRIHPLVAGIITMTGLYSTNLAIMGSANISITDSYTLTRMLAGLHVSPTIETIIYGTVLYVFIVIALIYFFKTESGQSLIATGDNEQMARALGIAVNEKKMQAFMLGNSLIALSGYLVATSGGFADIGMGIGTVVIGLASIIIGEVIVRQVSLPKRLGAILIGSVIYRLLLAVVLALNVNPKLFKLFSAMILALALALPALQARMKQARHHTRHEGGQ